LVLELMGRKDAAKFTGQTASKAEAGLNKLYFK
jgi:hypothetical protein